jgi:hypothetical protein
VKTFSLLVRKTLSNKPVVFALVACMALAVAVAEYARQIPLVRDATEVSHAPAFKAADGRSLTLLVFGDWGSGNADQMAVAALLERLCVERSADAVLSMGDNFYPEGVRSVDDPMWQTRWRDVYSTPCLKGVPFYLALGNHDYQGEGDPGAQIRYSRVEPGHWVMPARSFTVTFGNLLTVSNIDSNFPDKCGLPFLCSLDGLEQSLARSRSTWRIAMGHHPALSGGKYVRLKPYARRTIPGFLCDNRFDAYFSGHEHAFFHIEGRNQDLPCDIRQVVVGNGGASLYAPRANAQPPPVFARAVHGAAVASFTAERAEVEFVAAPSGEVVHRFAFTPGQVPGHSPGQPLRQVPTP